MHATCPPHRILYHPNTILWRLQVVKRLMKFLPSSCYLFSLLEADITFANNISSFRLEIECKYIISRIYEDYWQRMKTLPRQQPEEFCVEGFVGWAAKERPWGHFLTASASSNRTRTRRIFLNYPHLNVLGNASSGFPVNRAYWLRWLSSGI
jgi:hypothetical protein